MWNFLVEITSGDLEGEMFFVQAHDIYEADEVVARHFKGKKYCYHGRFTDAEVEALAKDKIK